MFENMNETMPEAQLTEPELKALHAHEARKIETVFVAEAEEPTEAEKLN